MRFDNALVTQEVSHSCGDFTVRGLISPPVEGCCVSSQAQQHMFINLRWHSPSSWPPSSHSSHASANPNCLLQATLCDLYQTALQNPSGKLSKRKMFSAAEGPLPKHRQPNNDSKKYPVYILNVECSPAAYSVLNQTSDRDGDIVFHNAIDLVECVYAALVPVFSKHSPQCLWLLKCRTGSPVTGGKSSNRMVTSSAQRKVARAPSAAPQEDECGGTIDSTESCAYDKSEMDLLFQYGFLDRRAEADSAESSSGRTEGDEVLADIRKRRRVCVARLEDVESELSREIDDDLEVWEEREAEASADVAEDRELWHQLSPTSLSPKFVCDELDETQEGAQQSFDLFLWGDAPHGFSGSPLSPAPTIPWTEEEEGLCDSPQRLVAECIREMHVDDDSINDNDGDGRFHSGGGIQHRLNLNADLNNDFAHAATALQSTSWHAPQSLRTQPTVLSKDNIAETLTCLRQVDDMFIVAVGNDQVLAVDQHAIHERILLEKLQTKLKSELPIVRHLKADFLQARLIDNSMVDFILHSDNLLKNWGFQHFTVQRSSNNPVLSLLRFSKLPLIEDEALTVDDFLEFMQLAQDQAQLPDHLKSPPAVQRTLASKSCRSAVKFGDSLNQEQCSGLLREVVQCAIPFQCAHGRPSIVPLLSLHPKKASARQRLLMGKVAWKNFNRKS